MAKTIEDAKKYLRLCNAAKEGDSWSKVDELSDVWEPCTSCCPECSTDTTIRWIWPELKYYHEEASPEEWKTEVTEGKKI